MTARPLRRRAASTRRPPRVDMRTRNPWVFARLRLFGWNVLFTFITPFRSQVASLGAGVGARVAEPAQSLAIVAAPPRGCQRTTAGWAASLTRLPSSPDMDRERSCPFVLPDEPNAPSKGLPEKSREIVDTVENAGFTGAYPVDNWFGPIVAAEALW
jgi:hypothetical protein